MSSNIIIVFMIENVLVSRIPKNYIFYGIIDKYTLIFFKYYNCLLKHQFLIRKTKTEFTACLLNSHRHIKSRQIKRKQVGRINDTWK